MINLYEQSCYGLEHLSDNSIDAIITDPPYGIGLEHWDKLPSISIWKDCFRVLKPGGFLLCFSSIKYQHLMTQNFIDSDFILKDVLLWIYLNGRVPSLNVDKKIDDHLGHTREAIGYYTYIPGSQNSSKKETYKKKNIKTKASSIAEKWIGFGTGLKTAYEPILMLQKPIQNSLAYNIIHHGVGALNIDETRIPYERNEKKVGHNPHPAGRVMSNIIQTEPFGDYQKFFFVGKVRDGKKTGNSHPTAKPFELMNCLIKLISKPQDTILDPFMGSGTTGVSAVSLERQFIGYEKENNYFNIAKRRIFNVK